MEASFVTHSNPRAARRDLAKSLASGNWHLVVDTATSIVEANGPTSELSGARKLLIEASTSIVLDGDASVTPMPYRLLAATDLSVLIDHAYGARSVDDMTRERTIGYLRRIGITASKDLENQPDLADLHETVAIGLTAAFTD